jgi:hypothetical protein
VKRRGLGVPPKSTDVGLGRMGEEARREKSHIPNERQHWGSCIDKTLHRIRKDRMKIMNGRWKYRRDKDQIFQIFSLVSR